ncbi:MAG: glycosyltransferase family A protein [Actinomycetota bacterium]|nr:glycosyltransferase family A protein [Actinomycetota bacterium]
MSRAPFQPHRHLLRRAAAVAVAEVRARRHLEAAACVLHHGEPQHIERSVTSSYDAAAPEVSVAVSLYNYAPVVADTLRSIVASTGVSLEIIVVDDHSHDQGLAVVAEFMSAHPQVPIVLLAKSANEGLEQARNTAFAAARSEFVMVVDADNLLQPEGLGVLLAAARANPLAAGAYGRLQEFGDANGQRSAAPWNVDELCRRNYIDAQALVRRALWQRLGGYATYDDDVYGWEDWDLWLRIAADGGQMEFVDHVVGRYRVTGNSMLSLTNLAHDDSIEALRRRHPTLPWPA